MKKKLASLREIGGVRFVLNRTASLVMWPLSRAVLLATSVPFILLFGEFLFHVLGMRRSGPRVLSSYRRILIVRLDEIGDVVMTTPLLRELRRNIPHAWITLVVKPDICKDRKSVV